MAQRDDIYRKFGPLLLEAIFEDLYENIKELRRATGGPEKSLEQLYAEIADRLTALEPYDWM